MLRNLQLPIIEISEWLNGTYDNTTINGANFESVIVPITDNNGMCVGVFEYKVSFDGLYGVGDTFESRVLFRSCYIRSCRNNSVCHTGNAYQIHAQEAGEVTRIAVRQ